MIQTTLPLENLLIHEMVRTNMRNEYLKENKKKSIEGHRKKFVHIKIAEKICYSIGFDIHAKNGHLILRNFLLFCFPKGIKSLITRPQLKYLSLKPLVSILKEIEKYYSKDFNSTKFKKFLEQTKSN
jgi:hypothetical protein